MRHPDYDENFYVNLRNDIVRNLKRVGHCMSADNKSRIVPAVRHSTCVPTGYDILGLEGKIR